MSRVSGRSQGSVSDHGFQHHYHLRAGHPASCWDKVATHLEPAGFKTDLVDLPSVGPAEHLKSFEPDVEQVRRHVIAAADAGQKVVLVCHSYGGLPTTQSVEGLDWETRQAEGKPGGIVHLVYCCSFVIPEGESLISAFGGNDLPWFIISDDKLQYFPNGPGTVFYNDMSEEDAKSATALLKPHSYQTAHSRLTYAGWKHVPSTYIYCLKGNAIPIFVQKMMVEQTAKGYGMRTETLDASHSPFWSMPKETAEAIQRAAES